jgi:hypothetical protein
MFVGEERRAALAQVMSAWDRVRSERSTQLVYIEGEPGWGKTRLVQEFYARLSAAQPDPPFWPPSLADGADVRQRVGLENRRKAVRPAEFDAPPGAQPTFVWLGHDVDPGGAAKADMSLVDLAEQVSLVLARTLRAREARNRTVRLGSQALGAIPGLWDVVGMTVDGHGLLEETVALVRAIRGGTSVGTRTQAENHLAEFTGLLDRLWGGRRPAPPAVIVIEDAHEARDQLVQLCRGLVADGDRPFLILACGQPRPEVVPIRGLVALRPERSLLIPLAPLEPVDLARLAEEVGRPDLAAVMAQMADGNPYHFELLLLVARANYGPNLEQATRDGILRMPPAISDLLEALWWELADEQREALARMALLGRRMAVLTAEYARLRDHVDPAGALRSGWMRQQTDMLRFLEEARWRVVRGRVDESLGPHEQGDLILAALEAVDAARGVDGAPQALLSEMQTALATEALHAGCPIDLCAVGEDVRRWGDDLRRSQDYAGAEGALSVAGRLAERALIRPATRRAGDELLLRVLTSRCHLARLQHGVGRPEVEVSVDDVLAQLDVTPEAPALDRVEALLTASSGLRVDLGAAIDPRARPLYDQATRLGDALDSPDPKMTARLKRASYGWLYRDGLVREATTVALACHEEQADAAGRYSEQSMLSLGSAALYAMRFDVSLSISLRRKVLAIRQETWGAVRHPLVALAGKELAVALDRLGGRHNLEEALGLVDAAFEVQTAHFGPEHYRTLDCMGPAARIRVRLARFVDRDGNAAAAAAMREEAARMAERNLESRLRIYPNRGNLIARTYYGVARAALGAEEGFTVLDSVLERYLLRTDAVGRSPEAEAVWVAQDLAFFLRESGRGAEADEVLARVRDRSLADERAAWHDLSPLDPWVMEPAGR